MTLRRKENWPVLLHDFVQSAVADEFAWGKHDCCLLVASAVEVMTGIDFGANYRGKYDSAAGAVKLIGQVCGGKNAVDLCVYFMNQYGCKELPSVLFAQRGDVVALEDDTIGFVYLDGKSVVCWAQDNRLHLQPVTIARRAWRIG